jgi:RNA polymerase sigma-70 factor (ECF subfamily)
MVKKGKDIELVKQAQLGDKDALERLAEVARERLRVHVYRLVLADDATEDIVQECMIEMFKILDKLKRADRFWSWLYGIAHNKILHYRRNEWRQKTMSIPDGRCRDVQKDQQEVLENLISQELKQLVSAAMAGLDIQQREVLSMRCYDEMSYSEIAESMGCSEVGAQMRFFRAKKALQKQLSRRGLGKGSLLMALALFGKMTAPSKAAAAQITVTTAATKVGVTASVAAIAASKATIVSLTTAGALAVGTMVVTSGTDKPLVTNKERLPGSSYVTVQTAQAGKSKAERWYYYPPNGNGTVMMRFKSDAGGRQSYCQWLQNDQANYYKHKNTVYIRNGRAWADDLSVRRLPTDRPELTDFLSQVEGKTELLEYVRHNGDGLLVIAKEDEDTGFSQTTLRHDASGEEHFRYNWLGRAKTIDNRDAMHRRGWTYFTVSGKIDGQKVSGAGRVPFVYEAYLQYPPWLRLRVGSMEIIDSIGDRLFKGLSRPWMGLHTIDTVRRDAAEQRIWFETGLLPKGVKARVTLSHNERKLVYVVDMEKDVVDRITFLSDEEQVLGELRFSYLQEIDNIGSEFAEPRRKSHQGMCFKKPGILWLVQLAEVGLTNNSN